MKRSKSLIPGLILLTAWPGQREAAAQNPYAQAVLADNPLVYYRFEESIGAAAAADSTPNGFNANYVNAALGNNSFNGTLGMAARFNNLEGASASSMAVPALGSDFEQVSLEVWAKPNSYVTFDTLYDADNFPPRVVHWQFVNDNRLEFTVNHAGGCGNDLFFGNNNIFRVGEWHHIVVTYDNTSGPEPTVNVYVNGTLIGTQNFDCASLADLPAAHIGSWNGNQRTYDGLLDEFALYTNALSSARVAAHYLAAVGILITHQPTDVTVLTNSDATFLVEAIADETVTYQWQKKAPADTDFADIPGATNASYITPLLDPSNNAETYRAVASAGGRSITSREAVLTVLVPEALPGPLAWLSFEDNMNPTADQSGAVAKHDGTLTGNAAIAPFAPNANAGTFSVNLPDGTSHVDLVNPSDLNVNSGQPFTMAAWIKTDFTSGDRVILAKSPPGPVSGGSGTHSTALYVGEDGKLVYDVWYVNEIRSSAVVRGGDWVQVAVVFDGANYQLFVNGQFDVSKAMPGANEGANGEAEWQFTVGSSINPEFPAPPGQDFIGNIDEVLFWNAALSRAQVLQLYNDGVPSVAITVTQQPADVLAAPGATATFTVAANPIGTIEPVRYQWQRKAATESDFSDIAGATNTTYTTPALAETDNGTQYRSVVSAGTATDTSRAAFLTVVGSSEYANAILADGPLVYYRFEEAEGVAVAYDSSTNGYHGAYANVSRGHSSVTNSFGHAAGFNNVSSRVAVPALGSFPSVTVEAWLKPNSVGDLKALYTVDDFPGGALHTHLDDNALFFSVSGLPDRGAGFVPTNQWTHVAFIYESTAQTIIFFINGLAVATNSYNASVVANLFTGSIGAWLSGGDAERFYDGLIDEFAIYGQALSAERIRSRFSGLPPNIVITANPASATLFCGEKATFSVGAGSTGTEDPLTYQWQKKGLADSDFSNIPGATAGSYTTSPVNFSDSGAQFRSIVNVAGLSVTSQVATLTVVFIPADAYPNAVQSDHPLVYYRFEEASSAATALDSSPNHFDGAYSNVVLQTASANRGIGQAGRFNGDASLKVPLGPDADNFYERVTLEAWVQYDGGTALWHNDGWSLGKVHFLMPRQWSQNGNNPTDTQLTGVNLQTGVWQHYAVVYDSVASNITAYVNGEEVSHQTYATAGPANLNAGTIGAWFDGSFSRFIDASIDEFAWYTNALSAERILAHYQAATVTPTNFLCVTRPANDQLVFSWTGIGFTLQSNPDLNNPNGWTDVVDGAVNPVMIPIPTSGHLFFRLRQ